MEKIELYSPDVKMILDLPTDWDEIDQAELRRYCEIMLTPGTNENEAKLNFFLFLLKHRYPGKESDFNKLLFRINPDDVATGMQLYVDKFFSSNTLTRNLIPDFYIDKTHLWGREDNFDNLTCGEFEDADIYLKQFEETKEVKYLLELTAVLYRPKNQPYMFFSPNIGKLETWNTAPLVKRMTHTPSWIIYATYMWFWACKAQMPEYFPTTFEQDEEGAESDPGSVFTRCIHAGAGPKNGSRDQIRVTLLKEFFLDMELEAIQAKKLKATYANN